MTVENVGCEQQLCLTWDSLCAYAFNQLGEEQRQQVLGNHLSSCILCQTAAEAILRLLKEQPFSKEELAEWFEGQLLLTDWLWECGEMKDLSEEGKYL
jgi:hypothetical protein